MAAYDGYVEGFRRRAEAARQALAATRAAGRAAADRAVRAVVDGFAPRRVILIGSLPRSRFFAGSDIDLAVEGLDAAQAAAAEEAAYEAAGASVDVLRLESMDPGWRAHHERFGQVVHDGR